MCLFQTKTGKKGLITYITVLSHIWCLLVLIQCNAIHFWKSLQWPQYIIIKSDMVRNMWCFKEPGTAGTALIKPALCWTTSTCFTCDSTASFAALSLPCEQTSARSHPGLIWSIWHSPLKYDFITFLRKTLTEM
jgi:hypothetical protein